MNKFEELLAKYGKTADEVTFEYENLSDEELEVAFKEAFEEAEEEAEQSEEKFVLKYELSHDDIRSALYSLLAAESDEDYYYTWILEVFDDKFIYQDYMENKFYRRGYSKDGDNVALDDNKVEVFNEWLSQAEKDALDALKADYAALKAFKETYDASVIKAQKNEILDKAEYECLAENKDFVQLRTDMDNYSIEEVSTKADLIFAAHMKSTMEFSAKDDGKKKSQVIGFSVNTQKEKKKKAYGKLFD